MYLGMVAHDCNPSTLRALRRGSQRLVGQSTLSGKVQVQGEAVSEHKRMTEESAYADV